MIPLSQETKDRIETLFGNERDYLRVLKILETECGDNLPMIQTQWTNQAERIRFAVLKLSQGNLHELNNAIESAKCDWRDTLMMAGFGTDLKAHLSWHP